MAFAGRIANVLKQAVSKNANANMELCSTNSMLYQAVRSMSSKLFVGGISYSTDDQSLQQAFAQHGEVVEARVIIDRDNGRSRGFGFVTFASEEDAHKAMQALDSQELHGRRIRVNFATEKPRPPRYDSGGGGYGGGSSYGGGGGYGGGSSYGGGGYGGGGSYGGGGYNSGGGGYGGGGYGGGGAGGGGGYGGNLGGNDFGGAVGGAGAGNDSFGDGSTNSGGFGTDEIPSAPGYGSTNLGVDGPEAADGDFKQEDGDEPNDFASRSG